jgi:hypothetical protein
MGFRSMRVINEDLIIPGDGFRSHSHREMEITLYVLKGAREQRERLAAARPQDREYRANLARSRRLRQHRLHRGDRERDIDPGAPYDRTSRLRPWRANAGWPREPCRLSVTSANVYD